MAKGFFVPDSISSNYVSNKRTPTGAYQWDTAASEIGLNKQAAIQTLNKQYSTTINNAYTNYLAASRGVQGSNMGQGYKEAYMQKSQENLLANIAETNLNAAKVRAELAGQTSQALGALDKQFTTEVGNMERVKTNLLTYYDYAKTLMKDNEYYIPEERHDEILDTMYDTLLNDIQARDYKDKEGNVGLSYAEWLRANLKDTQADREWSQWLFGLGGFDQFKTMTKKGVKSQ